VFTTVVRSMTPYGNMVHCDRTGDMARICSSLIQSHENLKYKPSYGSHSESGAVVICEPAISIVQERNRCALYLFRTGYDVKVGLY
jgi:hypothetical protein